MTYPPSPERDHLVAILSALIVQVKTAQAVANAATDIEQVIKSPGQPQPSPPPSAPVTTPALPPVSSSLGSRILKSGLSGADVTEWQQKLGALGFPVGVDGQFGPETDAATRAFQKSRGLQVDGQVGPNTLAAALVSPSAPIVPSVPLPTSSGRILSRGMSGDDVKAWQAVLVSSGYAITVDGQFGPATEAATMDWQTRHGIPADGKVGPQTLSKIGMPPEAPLVVPSVPVPQPLPAAKSPREIAAEAAGIHLLELQKKHGMPAAKGKEDLTIVKRFQKEAGLTQDGKAGPGTLLAMAQSGFGTLPKVMYWPTSATRAKDLPKYQADLRALAQAARLNGFATLAAQIDASAAAENGAGGLA
jgi:peptidoglycan hydrolase-like protein with peptidoglycan-binding domain